MLVVAIDGPAGAGKSTIARALAERLGLAYLDTGAMYRAVTLAALRAAAGAATRPEVAEIARRMTLDVGARVLLDGEDVTGADPLARRSTSRSASSRPTARCATSCATASGRGRPSTAAA